MGEQIWRANPRSDYGTSAPASRQERLPYDLEHLRNNITWLFEQAVLLDRVVQTKSTDVSRSYRRKVRLVIQERRVYRGVQSRNRDRLDLVYV